MPSFDFRILLETIEGIKSSYYSSSFVNTDNDGLVLSASQVYHRITGSVSASYQNQAIFSGSDVNPNFTFKDNLLLSASLSGSLNTGSLDFTATTSEYDRLLRYKFFGEKVCNVLGLPHAQWVYVDQFSLNPDDDNNFFEGNVNAQNLFIGDSITFANDSTVNSDIPFLIDTGSDRHIKFIDERNFGTRALIMGYDKTLDVYEISGSDDKNFNIGGVDRIIFSDGTTQTSAGGGGAGTVAGSDTQVQFNSSGNFAADADLTFNGDTLSATFLSTTNITASGNISASGTQHIFGAKVGIGTNSPVASGLQVNGELGIHDGSGAVHTQLFRETSTGGITFKRVSNSDGSDSGGEFIKAKYGEFIVTGDISASGQIDGLRYNAPQNLEGNGGYKFGGRDDTGMFENAFNIGIVSPENVQINIDSNANDTDSQFAVVHHNETVDGSPANPLFQVFEDGRTLFSTASVAGVTINHAAGHITASGEITANRIVTTQLTSSFLTSSTSILIQNITSSGDSLFGNDASDTHLFTGPVTITGSSRQMLSISSSFAGPSGLSVARNSGDRIDLFANYSGYGGGLNSTDALRFSTNDSGFNSPSMYIETNGRVGIGTTSPARNLHISSSGVARVAIDGQGGSNARLHFVDGGDDRWNIGNAVGDKAFTFYDGNSIVKFFSGSSDANTLVVSGSKVGIGTASPDSKLHISYNDSTTEGSVTNNFNDVGLQIENTNADGVAAIQFRSSDADGYIFYDDSGTNAGNFHFKTDGGDGASVLTLLDGGNVGIGTESPSQSLSVVGNILLQQDAENDSFIHANNDLAISSDAGILIVADTNDTGGDAVSDIIFGAGSAVDTNGNKDFTFAQAYPSVVPRLEAMRIRGDSQRVGIGTVSPSASLEVWSENSQEYHYPLIIRNPYNNNVPNNNYGVGMKFHLDDANDNKFAAISYEANTGYGNDGYLRFFVDGTGLTTTPSSSQAQLSLASNGNITASGNISASGTGHFSDLNITHGGTAITLNRDGHESVTIGQGNADRFFIRNINDGRNDLVILDDGKTAIGGNDAPTRQLVVAGTISGSGDLDIVGNITGSGGRFNSNVGIGPDDYIPSRLLDLSGSNGNGEMILVRGNKDAGGTIRYQRGTSYSWRAGVGGGSSTDSNIPSSFWGIEDVSDSNTVAVAIAHSTQRVGIGTVSPSSKLTVISASMVAEFGTASLEDQFIAVRHNNDGRLMMGIDSSLNSGNGGALIQAGLNKTLNFAVDNATFGVAPAMTIAEDGNVGIGTETPERLLSVSASVASHPLVTIENASGGAGGGLQIKTTDGNGTGTAFEVINYKNVSPQTIMKIPTWKTATNIGATFPKGYVGIGTETPTAELQVEGVISASGGISSSGDLTVDGSGTFNSHITSSGNISSSAVGVAVIYESGSFTKLGVGTTNPVSSLHVEEGDIRIDTAENGTQALRFSDRNTTKAQIQYVDNGEKLHILTGGSTKAISIDNSQNVGIGTDSPTEVLDVNGNIKTTGNVSSPTFFSGFTGNGFRITSGSDGKTSFTVDDLTVRETMNVYELLINQVRATNGSLFVSSTGKVEAMSGSISSSAVVTGSGFLSNYPSGLTTSSLLVHYTFNDGGKTPIQDYSGNANTGSASLSTNLSTDAGYLGMGAEFISESYDMIHLPTTVGGTTLQQFTIAMWVKRDSHNTFQRLMSAKDINNLILFESANDITFRIPGVASSFSDSNPNQTHFNNARVLSGSWTHVACTYNQVTSSVYINGVLKGEGHVGAGTVDFGTHLVIGADPDVNDKQNYSGMVDDFRLYTGSLNVDEIKSLFSGSEGVLLQTGDNTNHGFDEGDVIRAQRFTGTGTFKSDMIVTRVDSATKFAAEPHSAVKPDAGFEYVRLGNTFDTDRQGAVYLTADDDDAPFIDIVSGVTKHSEFNTSGKVKTRIGKLDGITTANPAFGTLSGFGFYASGSAFLEGGINATSGAIGDFIIDNTEIRDTNNDLRLKSSGQITGSKVLFNGGTIGGFTIDAHSLTSTGIEINDSTQGTFISSSNFKVSHTGDVTASNVDLSGKITATDGEIGGFTIDSDEIKAGSTLILDSDTNSGEIKLGGASDITTGDGIYMAGDKKFRVGQASDNFIRFNNTANVLEIKTDSLNLDSSGNLTVSGTLSSSVGNIGGFTIDSSEIKSNNASGETGLRLKAGGQITASNAKITGDITATSGEFSGDVIATHINTTSGSIGGFVIGSSAISSSNLALSSSNGGRIVLGSNEETILSGSGEGQFAGGNFSFDKSGNVTIANAELSLPVLKPSSEFFDVANSKFVCLISGSNGAVDAEIGYGTFESNTTITILGTGSNADMNRPIKETIFVENAYASGSIANSSLNFGDIIEADKPITLVESAFGTVGKGKEGTPLNFAAKQFLTYGDRRQPVQVNMYSPFAQGSVTMSVHSSSLTDPYGGDYQPHTSGTIEADGTLRLYGSASAGIFNDEAESYAYLIESTVPIVAQSTGVGSNDSDDTTTLMPLDSVIHNVDSGNDISIRLTTDMAQKIFTAVTSSVTGTALVTPGEEGSARGQVITSSNNVLFQYHLTGDGAGTDAVQGIGSNTIGDTYIIPHPVGGVQILSSEPAIISCSRMNGDGTLTAFFACDHSAASVTSPLGFTTGSVSHGYDEEDTDGSNISQSLSPVGLYIEGTGNFALRTNTFGDDEYTPLGYRRNTVTSYNQNVRYFFEPANTTTITGDRIKTGKIQSNNLSTTIGSEFNLNDGTFKLGGTSNPDLQFDGTTLIISGTVSSSVGNIGGFTISSDEIKSNNASGETGLRLKADGSITASSANISGVITSSAGLFSGNVTSEATMSGGVINTSNGNDRVEIDGNANDLKFFENNSQAITLGKLGTISSGKGASGGNDEYGLEIVNAEAKIALSKTSTTYPSLLSNTDVMSISPAAHIVLTAGTDTDKGENGVASILGELKHNNATFDDSGIFGAVVGRLSGSVKPDSNNWRASGLVGIDFQYAGVDFSEQFSKIPVKHHALATVGDVAMDGNVFITGSLIISGSDNADSSHLLTLHHNGAGGVAQGIMIVRNKNNDTDSGIQTDDILGGIGFDSNDGNVAGHFGHASAFIAAYASQAHGVGEKGGYLSFGVTDLNDNDDTTTTEYLRIGSGGVTTIFNGGEFVLRDGNITSDVLVRMYDSGDDGIIDVYQNNSVKNRIHGNGDSYFTGGNVGIGTDSPGEALEVAGQITSSNVISSTDYPAFSARCSNSDGIDAAGEWQSIIMDEEMFDNGGDFDHTAGIPKFTAPVKGLYQFNLNVTIEGYDSDLDDFAIRLRWNNGVDYGHKYDLNNMLEADPSGTGTHHSFGFSKSFILEAGDEIYPQHFADDTTGTFDEAANVGSSADALTYLTWFDGHLVTPL